MFLIFCNMFQSFFMWRVFIYPLLNCREIWSRSKIHLLLFKIWSLVITRSKSIVRVQSVEDGDIWTIPFYHQSFLISLKSNIIYVQLLSLCVPPLKGEWLAKLDTTWVIRVVQDQAVLLKVFIDFLFIPNTCIYHCCGEYMISLSLFHKGLCM